MKELAKEFRKRNGRNMPAEIVLVGGAAILVNYGFREMTYKMMGIPVDTDNEGIYRYFYDGN